MNKDKFLECIDLIQKQIQKDDKCADAFGILTDQNRIWYDNGSIFEAALIALETQMQDESEWIRYWVWELDCGKEYKPGTVTEENKNIPLRTPEDLWNLLNKNLKSKCNEE